MKTKQIPLSKEKNSPILLSDNQFLSVYAASSGVLFRVTELLTAHSKICSSHLVPYFKLESATNHPAQFESLIKFLLLMLELKKRLINRTGE